jgi:hypothetical protein
MNASGQFCYELIIRRIIKIFHNYVFNMRNTCRDNWIVGYALVIVFTTFTARNGIVTKRRGTGK